MFILQQELQTFSVGSKIKRSATTTQKGTCEGKVDINGTEGHQHCCGQLDCDEVLLVAHQQPVRRRKSKKVFKNQHSQSTNTSACLHRQEEKAEADDSFVLNR